MRTFWRDLRYGARMLLKKPGFALIAVLTLALGVGANTAIFQLLNAVRLRSLPVRNPEELAEVRIASPRGRSGDFNGRRPELTNPLWELLQERQRAFDGLFAWSAATFDLAPRGEQRFTEDGLWVSGDFFNALGVRSALGRVFTRADDQRGCGSPGAVISYAFWQRAYGGDPAIVGRKITLDGHPVQVIGVTEAGFFGVEVGRGFDVAAPICAQAAIKSEDNRIDHRASWWLGAMGRLKPGWTLQQATAHLNSISPGMFRDTVHPGYTAETAAKYRALKLEAQDASSGVSSLRGRYNDPLTLLLAIAGLVLLIACANLANLMLARASAREREIVVRLALGASRARLVRQLMTESFLLAAVGAGVGAWMAGNLSHYVVSLISTEATPLFVALDMDWRVFGFTAGVAVLTCVLFGLAPALRAIRVAPAEVMKSVGRGLTTSREGFSLRRALVVSQIALSVVLLIGALLFTRSLFKLMTLDAGFAQDGVLEVDLNLTQLDLPVERRYAFKRELLGRARAMPGVEAAASVGIVPLDDWWNEDILVDSNRGVERRQANFNRVSSDYFRTLSIPLLAGRDFGDGDTGAAPKVAIVNESFARSFLDGANPLGRTFRIEVGPGAPDHIYQIVALVKDTKYINLRENFGPIVYLAASQEEKPGSSDQILLRSNLPVMSLITEARQALGAANPGIAFHFRVFKTQIRESLARERLMATLSGFFGALAALLASIGLYGVLSYAVAQRTQEIGVRLALGADRGRIVKMIMREATMLLAIGLAVGIALALAAAKTASALLYGLRPHDPATYLLAVTFLAAVAAAASYLPARRASRVDPMVALKCE
ncbi:MAG TPA: ABC transporter permease [Blastocatellia bacterium]|jgi:predicted permease|nr:ABC transporter permease [Blastocatellia bacterium]